MNHRSSWFHGLIVAVFCVGVGLAPVSRAVSEPPLPAETTQAVSLMEQEWLGVSFPSQPLESRISRLEALLYGRSRQGTPMPERLKALAQRYAATVPPPTRQPAPNTSLPPTTSPVHPPATTTGKASGNGLPGTASSVYPVVDQMERQVLGQTYPAEPVETRLARLETRTFGKPQTGSLFERVEVLKVKTGIVAEALPPVNTPGATEDDTDTTPTLQAGSALGARIAALEQQVLQQTYQQEGTPERLNRLELKVFQQVAPVGVTPPERVARLEAVTSAIGSQAGAKDPLRRPGAVPTAVGIGVPLAIMILMMLF